MFIFLDESGNFHYDDYFIIGGFIVGDQRRTSKAFRKWQQRKFRNKKLRYRAEVKFTDTRLTDDLRLKTLKYFAAQDIRIFYAFLRRKNIPLEFRKKKGIEAGRLYTEIVAQTLSQLFPSTETDWNILADKRHLKKVSHTEFRKTIKLHLLLQAPKGSRVFIDLDDSTTNPNIQIADWICGALYRYYMKRRYGKHFYNSLKNNIIASKEVFKDYWQNQYKQKTPLK